MGLVIKWETTGTASEPSENIDKKPFLRRRSTRIGMGLGAVVTAAASIFFIEHRVRHDAVQAGTDAGNAGATALFEGTKDRVVPLLKNTSEDLVQESTAGLQKNVHDAALKGLDSAFSDFAHEHHLTKQEADELLQDMLSGQTAQAASSGKTG